MKLYGTHYSPRYRRVAIAAHELGLPLELVELNIRGGENRAPAYLEKNPMGKVPSFEDDDGWVLWESCAILTYLGEKYAEKRLFPTELRARADALRWMFWSASHLDPAVAQLYAQKFLGKLRGQPADEAVVAAAGKELSRFLPVLEQQLSERSWVLGAEFSLVDVALGAGIDALLLPEVEFDRAPFPHIDRWHDRLKQRASWTAGKKG